MKKIIPNKPIRGVVKAPESKSFAHRYLIAGYLAGNRDYVHVSNHSDDVTATEAGLKAILSASDEEAAIVECNDSGSTFRFLLPLAAALGRDCKFMISNALSKRPTEPLYHALKEHGAVIKELDYEEEKCVRIREKLFAGEFDIPGNVSNQFISGLMFALPLLEGQSTIVVKGELQSKSYVDMTIAVLREAGIEITEESSEGLDGTDNAVYVIPGNQTYRLDGERKIEGDWSNAAVWLAAGALSGPVTCTGLNMESMQGDKKIVDIIKDFGAEVKVEGDSVTVSHAPLKGIELDITDNPDLLPEVSLISRKAEGETVIKNSEKFKFREFNRLKTVGAALKHIDDDKDKDKIEIDCFGDHRIAMMAAVAACIAEKPVEIAGSECVSKSYPGFFEELEKLM